MAAAGVPVVPAVEDDRRPTTRLAARGRRGRLPAHGQGRGGRRRQGDADRRAPRPSSPTRIAAARREASAAFGDGTLLVERLVEGARHVEVQVLADAHGDVVHLRERDCSTQRRHQKVLEEAPAPTISAAVRETLHRLGRRALAREVGYVNAGTVEFMVAGADAFYCSR